MDKGTFSNIVSAVLWGLGIGLRQSFPGSTVAELVYTAGIFAFSGGITNALAVKMLFDRIPGVIGSGVIPARFEEIRTEVKRLILDNFFTHDNLKQFLTENARGFDCKRFVKSRDGQPPAVAFVAANWQRLASPEAMASLVDKQVEKLLKSPAGGLLALVGGKTIHDLVGKLVASLADAAREKALAAAAEIDINAAALGVEVDVEELAAEARRQVERLLSARLEQLSAEHVKRMMEDVMRKHLGWLVVWGNVLGAILGVGSYFLS